MNSAHERLDLVLAQLPLEEKLATAGTALLQMSEILSRRAEVFLRNWRDAHNNDGPILDLDDEMEMVRQSMVLDDELIADSDPVTRRTLPREEGESIVVLKDKASLLAELEADLHEDQPEDVLQVLEEEDVGVWVSAIRDYLDGKDQAILFSDLVNGLGLAPVAVLIGVLLGGFRVEQRGGFYGQGIWVG